VPPQMGLPLVIVMVQGLLKSSTPFEAAQIDSPFCLEKGGNLKSIHKYYSHLQLQIHVNRVTFGETEKEVM